MADVFIGIGSNLGDRQHNLKLAVEMVGNEVGAIISRSSVIETEPWGFESENLFLNMVIRVETELQPGELLDCLTRVETEMGRQRQGGGYHSRIIDLDILFYNDLIIDSDLLTIPHPLLHNRMFVLESLYEIAPALVHPILNKTIEQLKIDLLEEMD